MKQTHKWSALAERAIALAQSGLSDEAIGNELGVKRWTVWKWRKDGKLPAIGECLPSPSGLSPDAWAAAQRHGRTLDATAEQLVELGAFALMTALDSEEPVRSRMQATARFQDIVKQLDARLSRLASTEKPAPVVASAPRSTVDPRGILTSVRG